MGIWHTYSYAINVNGLENSIFAKEIELPNELGIKKKVYRVSALDPFTLQTFLPYNFSFLNVGNQKLYFFKYNPKRIEERNGTRGFQYFMLHEAFHEFRQGVLWKNIASEEDIEEASKTGNYEKVDKLKTVIDISEYNNEVYQLMILEINIIDKALLSDNISETEDYLKEWAKVRNYRNTKHSFTSEEKKVETLEGAAKYIERSYARTLGLEYKPIQIEGDKKAYLGEFFTDIGVDKAVESRNLCSVFSKELYYFTGSNLGLIYDEIGLDWKPKVENEMYVPDIGIDAMNIQESDISEEEINKIKEKYIYDSYEELAKKIDNDIRIGTRTLK